MRPASVYRALLLLGLVVLPAAAVGAQQRQPRQEQSPQRDSLEARVRQRMGEVLRRQLGLNDEQLRRLQQTNRRFEGQRRQLFEQERETRGELRRALAEPDSGSQERVGALLDRTLVLQRQRLELIEAEQKELATFLTPVQRARLFGLEEQMRRRAEELREQGPPPPAAGRRPGVRPGAGRRPPAAH